MTKFFKAISLLLCAELILGPIGPNFSLLIQDVKAQSCPTGLQFDSTLNRCLTSDQTAKVLNVTRQCGNNTDCYKQNAIAELQKAESENKAPKRIETKGMMSTVGNVLAVAGPLAILISGTATATSACASVSFWSMTAGSLSFIVGDNLANMQHAGRLKKIKEKWGKIVNPEQAKGNIDKEREMSQNAQSEAFGLLAEAEESLSKAASMKKTFYMIAGIAYSVSAIAAGVEAVTVSSTGGKDICKSKTAANSPPAAVPAAVTYYIKDGLDGEYVKTQSNNHRQKQFFYNLKRSPDLASFIINKKAIELSYSSPSLDDYEEMKKAFSDIHIEKESFEIFKELGTAILTNLSPLPKAHAQGSVDTNAAKSYKEEEAKGINWLGLGVGAGLGVAGGFALKAALKKWADKQLIMPITRAALGTLMAAWSLIMSAHAGKQAEASKKRAELLKQMQKDFNVASNTLNVCKAEDRDDPSKPECYCYTPQNQKNPNRGSSQVCQNLWAGVDLTPTNYLAKNTETKICITNDRQADPTCSCRAKNTCMKVGVNGLDGLNTGSMSVLSKSLDPVNKLASGADAGSFGDASLANMASRLKDMNKQLDNKLGDLKKDKNEAMEDITATLTKGTAGMTNNPLLGSSGSNMPSNPGEAARMLEKEIAGEVPKLIGGSNGSIATPSNRPNKEEIGLNLTGGSDEKDEKVAKVMKQNMDYGKNDISNGTSSIFDILSNRYKRSGMRRLFDEEGKTKADPPKEPENFD